MPARTSSVLSTSRLLTWQVTHHAAVKSTNTARPAPVSSVTLAGVNATQPAPSAAAACARGAPAVSGANSGQAIGAGAATSAATPAMPHGRAPPVRRIRHAHSAKPDAEQHREEPQHRVVVALRAQHPREPDHRRVEREREQLLEVGEPRPRARQPRPPAGKPREQHVRQRHPEPERDEHQQRDRRRPRQRVTQRRAHERRRARRGDHDHQHAGAEGVERAVLRRPSGDARRRQLAELEHAGQVERQHEEQDRERGHHRRRLQLEPPAELLARRAQRREHEAQRDEREHHAAGEGDGLPAQRRPAVLVRGKAQHLDRQHREHAGHQVENDAAQQREQHRRGERQALRPGRRRDQVQRGRGGERGLRPGGHAAGQRDVDGHRARLRSEAVGGRHDAGDAREIRRRDCWPPAASGRRRRRRAASFCARRGLDAGFGIREEVQRARIGTPTRPAARAAARSARRCPARSPASRRAAAAAPRARRRARNPSAGPPRRRRAPAAPG